jgi:hypothetical protein
LEGAAALPALKEEPAFVDFGAGDQAGRAGGLRGFASSGDMLERGFVFPFFAMGAAFPEMSEEAEVVRQNAVTCAQDGFERSYRLVHVFGGEAVEGFSEFPFEGVDEPELRDTGLGELSATLFEKGEVAVAEIDPLRETEQERDGFRATRSEESGHCRVRVE